MPSANRSGISLNRRAHLAPPRTCLEPPARRRTQPVLHVSCPRRLPSASRPAPSPGLARAHNRDASRQSPACPLRPVEAWCLHQHSHPRHVPRTPRSVARLPVDWAWKPASGPRGQAEPLQLDAPGRAMNPSITRPRNGPPSPGRRPSPRLCDPWRCPPKRRRWKSDRSSRRRCWWCQRLKRPPTTSWLPPSSPPPHPMSLHSIPSRNQTLRCHPCPWTRTCRIGRPVNP